MQSPNNNGPFLHHFLFSCTKICQKNPRLGLLYIYKSTHTRPKNLHLYHFPPLILYHQHITYHLIKKDQKPEKKEQMDLPKISPIVAAAVFTGIFGVLVVLGAVCAYRSHRRRRSGEQNRMWVGRV